MTLRDSLIEQLRDGLLAEVRESTDFQTAQDWFHDGQLEAWSKEERTVAVISGTQGGKSVFGPWWLLREIQRKGPGDYAIVGPTLELLKKKALPEMVRVFTDNGLGRYKQTERIFEFSPEGLVKMFGTASEPCTIFVGYATKSDSLESATYKAVWADEAGQADFKLGSYQALNRRLSIHQGRILFSTTPYTWNWLKSEIYDRWVNNEEGYTVVNFPSNMNPAFPDAEYERQKKLLPDWLFGLMYEGKFTKPAGVVFPSFFDKGRCERFEIPPTWRRFSGHDFGPIHTAGCFAAQDPESGIVYIYGTYLPGEQRTTENHAASMLKLQNKKQPPMAWGGAPSEDGWRDDFSKVGYLIRKPPVADLFEGIYRLDSLMQRGLFKVFDDLKHLCEEFTTYSYELSKTGEVLDDKIQDKETYHRIDCCRYLACALYEGLADAIPDPESRFEKQEPLKSPRVTKSDRMAQAIQ
jgi:hypothetical protein